MTAAVTLIDFEGDFNDTEYVERLARIEDSVNIGPLKKPEEFCPDALLKSFQESIIELNQLKTKNQKKVDKIEKQCYIIAKEHEDNLKKQRVVFQDSHRTHEQLELKVRNMAAKVVHLGDQLETANKKKNRTEEALQLIKYFNIFQRNEENETKLFSNTSQVFEAAKVLDILTSFATDLPDKYTEVRSRIEAKSRETEKSLLKEFHHAHTHEDTQRMRKCGQTLSLFPKSYETCIQNFINEGTRIDFKGKITLFNQVTQLCHKTQKVIVDTFDNPEQVTAAFVVQVFDKIIKTHVRDELKDINKATDIDEYLSQLSVLYDKTTLLGRKLVEYEMIQDIPTATKQIKNLFYDYLHDYAEEEIQNFGTKGRVELEEYYRALFDTTGMQKKVNTTPSGGYRPRRETIRNVTVDVLFVSQDFITNILTATRECINRCKVLCNPNELSVTVRQIYKAMMELICRDHLDYAVNLSLTG
eukprot:TRINITY_DN1063_c0_g1_i3.p1 TRINITY_DN1063_c0_g1~~TRINITY_DN1063_c0_g1_i3.p1  ORF type:complete len:485 (-),score=112.93 TRINITY_DN1063_c0_g1_i3:1250-2665(-)